MWGPRFGSVFVAVGTPTRKPLLVLSRKETNKKTTPSFGVTDSEHKNRTTPASTPKPTGGPQCYGSPLGSRASAPAAPPPPRSCPGPAAPSPACDASRVEPKARGGGSSLALQNVVRVCRCMYSFMYGYVLTHVCSCLYLCMYCV